jgi:hypothetical protein
MKPTNRWNGSTNGAEKQPLTSKSANGKSVAKTSVRISDERLFASLTAAAKRDNRTVANFVLRLVEKAQPYWEKNDWDKNYFDDSAGGVSLPFSVSPHWRS